MISIWGNGIKFIMTISPDFNSVTVSAYHCTLYSINDVAADSLCGRWSIELLSPSTENIFSPRREEGGIKHAHLLSPDPLVKKSDSRTFGSCHLEDSNVNFGHLVLVINYASSWECARDFFLLKMSPIQSEEWTKKRDEAALHTRPNFRDWTCMGPRKFRPALDKQG